MTPPRPLGNVAKNAIEQLNGWNRIDVLAFTSIALAAARGDLDTVIALAEAGAQRNIDALTVGIYTAAGDLSKADEVIMEQLAAEARAKKGK